jgi:transposase
MEEEPTMPLSSVSRWESTFLGLDVARDSIAVGILGPGDVSPVVEKNAHDEVSIRRLVSRFDDRARLEVCYEAGPTGYDLYRLVRRLGVACTVIAPSLVPVAQGDRVKTDRRDAARLTRLFRAGELVAIRVPSEAEEGVRDLCRARRAVVEDRRRARQRLSGFLLRHGRVWRDGAAWTIRHHRWLEALHFADPAVEATYRHYFSVVGLHDATLEGIDRELAGWYDRPLFADAVSRLAAYRGIDHLGALTLAAEICDWRRFATAGSFMGFVGLVPAEYSSGRRERRQRLTKAGNAIVRAQLIESAWAYRFRPALTKWLRDRHDGVAPDTVTRSWHAQQRLCRRYRQLAEHKPANVAVTAVARELAGFVWAEMKN